MPSSRLSSRQRITGHSPKPPPIRAIIDVIIRIDGKEAAKGRVPRSAPLAFTANDAFDVGRDSYSPVSLSYFDRRPFAFNGKIEALKVQYLK